MVKAVVVVFAVSASLCASPANAEHTAMLQPLSFFWNSPIRVGNTAVIEIPLVLLVDWTDELAFSVELTPSFTHGIAGGVEYESRKILGSFGLMVREGRGGGFFATPKLLGVLAVEGSGTLLANLVRAGLDEHSSQLSFGADIGYEWRMEKLVIAVVGGVSAGLGRNLREVDPADIFSASLVAPAARGIAGIRSPTRPVMDVNFNLLRVGVPF